MPSSKEYHRVYYQKNKEKIKARSRSNHLQSRYGLTPVQYNALLEAQDYECAICGANTTNTRYGVGNLHVDHCHETGDVRGLLCLACNGAIGLLGDNPSRVASALNYLLNTKPFTQQVLKYNA